MTNMVRRANIDIVSGFYDQIPSTAIDNDFTKIKIRQLLRNKHGIYALFDKGELYYIGRATGTDLYTRIKDHYKRDRHKGKWDTFSFATLNTREHGGELESLILSLYMPEGNRSKPIVIKRDYRTENVIKRIVDIAIENEPNGGRANRTSDTLKLTEFPKETRKLYEQLERKIYALNRHVVKEPKAKYIAFKINDANFVDVRPQKKGIKLWLNLRKGELRDRKNLARNVRNIGHWGNGDYEISISETDSLPYLLTLIKQSYERAIS